MKQIAVNKLHRGELFAAFGHEYVVLDHTASGVLALESNTLDCMAFGKTNDWRKSAIREYLNSDYLGELVEEGLDPDHDILPLRIDLKETNGGREYGFDTCRVGLLTLEQYFRYNEYIPLADEDWWLATPWGTPDGRSPYADSSSSAWFIYTNGVGNCNYTSVTGYGPRPALLFNSSLLVEVETADADTLVVDETFKELAEKAAVEIVDAVIHAIAEKFKGKKE